MKSKAATEALQMYREGATLREVGEMFGVSSETIRRLVFADRNRVPYPNLVEWMRRYRYSIAAMAYDLGEDEQAMRTWLEDDTMPKRVVDKVLRLTGMTYEMAFKR